MHRQPRQHNRIPLGLIAAAVVAVAVPLLVVLAWLWVQWSLLDELTAGLLRFVLFGGTLSLGIGYGIAGLTIAWRRWADHRYISAHHIERLTLAQRSQGLPESVTSLSYHDSHKDAPEPAQALLAPPAIALSAEAEWLGWTDQAPHLMVAGRTDSGKTTTVEAVLARRITAGDLVLVIDPHYQAGKWLGAAAIGGGRDYVACYDAFDKLRALLDLRYKAFNAGTKTEDFKRVTVIVDEVPAIIARAQSDKALYERWLLFATELGSEARKVRVSVILLTQSPLVRDIGISSAMRENFTRIALGDTAADLLREEPDADRKLALRELLRSRPYPAAMEYRNNWYALRNDDVPRLAQTNGMRPRALSLALSPLPPTQRVAPAQPLPPTTQLSMTIPDQILLTLDGAGRHMTASEVAQATGLELQLVRVVIGEMHKAGQLSRRKCQGRTTRETYEYARLNHKSISGRLVASA